MLAREEVTVPTPPSNTVAVLRVASIGELGSSPDWVYPCSRAGTDPTGARMLIPASGAPSAPA